MTPGGFVCSPARKVDLCAIDLYKKRIRGRLYPKAAFLLYNIAVLRPFINGNKRTAYEIVRLFLRPNGYEVKSDSSEAYDFLLNLAAGQTTHCEPRLPRPRSSTNAWVKTRRNQ